MVFSLTLTDTIRRRWFLSSWETASLEISISSEWWELRVWNLSESSLSSFLSAGLSSEFGMDCEKFS